MAENVLGNKRLPFALILAGILVLGTFAIGLGGGGGSGHTRLTLNFASSGTPSKYSLDADPTVVNGLTNTIVRQGQFPNLNGYLLVFYVWCDTTVSGGSLILQQTGGTGWTYTFACGTGQSSGGDPGSIATLFAQNIANANQYDIVYSNTNALADTMQGGFVISSTATEVQTQVPASASIYIMNTFQIATGQSVHVWYETGNAVGCASGTLVCWIGVVEVSGGRLCKLDLSGGVFMSSGTPDGSVEVCTMGPVAAGGQQNFRVDVANTDTGAHQISGFFLISIY